MTRQPLEEYLGVLPEHFANWDLADRYVEVHIRKRLPANWKASAEAFLEAYHILETHSQSIYTAGDANAQYDVFGDHVSRFIHTIGTTSPHVPPEKRPDEQGILNMLMARKNPGHEIPEIPEGQRARDVYARHMQAVLGEQYDNDFSHLSVTETIDSIEYFLFPNAFFFPGLQIPLCYRFRPDGPDPDRCIYEVLYLRPKPRSGPTPEPAEPFDLDVDDSYTTVPGLPTSLGQVLDQDTTNLAAQTRGFKASKKRGQTLGNYQEIRARHFQSTVRRYIAEGRAAAGQRHSPPTNEGTEHEPRRNRRPGAPVRRCRRSPRSRAMVVDVGRKTPSGNSARVAGSRAATRFSNSGTRRWTGSGRSCRTSSTAPSTSTTHAGTGIGSVVHHRALAPSRRLPRDPARVLRRHLRRRRRQLVVREPRTRRPVRRTSRSVRNLPQRLELRCPP